MVGLVGVTEHVAIDSVDRLAEFGLAGSRRVSVRNHLRRFERDGFDPFRQWRKHGRRARATDQVEDRHPGHDS